ncbi:hypothetical protein ACTOI6_18850 (plasmid) [Komagataeibacter intermedius]|uniref:hypothetical protein n=1 Tax=Komagataeibacter intermedius TaxID=66229 RepID=UPI004037019A
MIDDHVWRYRASSPWWIMFAVIHGLDIDSALRDFGIIHAAGAQAISNPYPA